MKDHAIKLSGEFVKVADLTTEQIQKQIRELPNKTNTIFRGRATLENTLERLRIELLIREMNL